MGNIIGLTSQYGVEVAETLSFGYDALDRLTGVSGAYSRSSSYDALGNLLVLGENSYSYGGAQPHAVTQVTGPTGSHSYGYDANGNMSSRIEHGVSYTQTFDIENRLVKVDATGSGGMINEYLYDAGGQRLRTGARWR